MRVPIGENFKMDRAGPDRIASSSRSLNTIDQPSTKMRPLTRARGLRMGGLSLPGSLSSRLDLSLIQERP
jgi:hypothetical protein